METKIDAASLFEAFGFTAVGEGLWRFEREIGYSGEMEELMKEHLSGEVSRKAAVVVEERRDGSFAGYVSAGPVDAGGIPVNCVFHRSGDPRDMVALAQSELASCMSDAIGDFPDEGFEFRGLHVTQPFKGGDYFDWELAPGADGERLELKSPVNTYGRAYVEWRDGFAERLLATPVPRL